jgi:hypothetical protein
MRRRLRILAISAALGLVLVAARTPAALGCAIAVVLAAVAIPFAVYCRRARRRAPQRLGEIAQRHFDPAAGPPLGSELRYAHCERCTLTGDRSRIRAIEVVAFTAPPVPV